MNYLRSRSSNIDVLFVGLEIIKDSLYKRAELAFSAFCGHTEGREYEACFFELNGKGVEHRSAKITPAKQGLFVAIWKRNKEGVTAPLDVSEEFDLLMITCRQANKAGQFVFAKSVLVAQKVIAIKGDGGKRGMRVYPPWEIPDNDQARKTQKWQRDHFIDVDDPDAGAKLKDLLHR